MHVKMGRNESPLKSLIALGSKRIKVGFCFRGNLSQVPSGPRMAGESLAAIHATIAQQLGLNVYPSILYRCWGAGIIPVAFGAHFGVN